MRLLANNFLTSNTSSEHNSNIESLHYYLLVLRASIAFSKPFIMHALSLLSLFALPVVLINGLTIKIVDTDVIVAPTDEKASITNAKEKDDYTAIGCYTDQASPRGLNDINWQDNGMTVESCADFCKHFTYFGVEFGTLLSITFSMRCSSSNFLSPQAKFFIHGADRIQLL
jgi:WSC domain